MKGLKYDPKKKIAKMEVTIAGTNGKVRKRQTLPVINEKDAEVKFVAFRERVLSGKPEPRPIADPMFRTWVKENWPVITADMKSEVAKRNESAMNLHIVPHLGHLRLSQIDIAAMKGLRSTLRSKRHGKHRRPYSSASINTVLILLKSILNKAHEHGALSAVPAFPERLKAATPMLELTADEERAFLGAFDDRDTFVDHYKQAKFRNSMTSDHTAVLYSWFRASKPVFVLGLTTGLRRGDLLNLRWSDVHLQEKYIRVEASKTLTPVIIPLSASAIAALQECRGKKMASTTWVFTQQDGDRYSLSTLRRHFRLAKKLAGIDRRFRFHDLRHTAGSKLASAGVSLQIISKILGHSTARMSERYARPDDAAVRAVAAAMDRV